MCCQGPLTPWGLVRFHPPTSQRAKTLAQPPTLTLSLLRPPLSSPPLTLTLLPTSIKLSFASFRSSTKPSLEARRRRCPRRVVALPSSSTHGTDRICHEKRRLATSRAKRLGLSSFASRPASLGMDRCSRRFSMMVADWLVVAVTPLPWCQKRARFGMASSRPA
jgi:hypothetical protein